MKIFDWVHRRFANKEGLTAESGKKSCVIDGDGETSYVGDNNGLKVFDGWKQGILTIGTLGYDPLKQKDECFDAADEAEEKNESDTELICSDSEEEETNPLVYANDCEKYDLEMKRDIGNENEINGEEFEFDAMIKKERITLAELFSADTEMRKQAMAAIDEKGQVLMKEDYTHNYSSNYKTTSANNNNNSKKLTAPDKDARPIHKLHRMMRMMLKRKIHPDEGLNSTEIGDNITTETASLLPSRDAII